MKKLLTLTVLLLGFLMAVPVSAAPIIIEPGFTVEVFATGLETPNDLTFNSSGSLLVSETGAKRVSRIEVLPDGTAGEISTVASGIDDAEGLALDASGNLFVSNADPVYKIADGSLAVFASGFDDPEGLAIDQSGDLFVADAIAVGIRISRIDILADGSAGEVSTFANVPAGSDAADIEFDAAGDLFIADGENEVWIVDILQDGSVAEIRPFVADLDSPFALEFDSLGNLFVGGSSGDIWRINSNGDVTQFATGFAGVEGLAFDALGNLFVSEFQEGRISKITREYVQVAIDIKPGSDSNPINCKNDKGVIPVAILTTDTFDATTVDHSTVTFEGASETHVDKKSGEPRRHEEDVDGDGDIDLVFHFRLGETDLTCASTEGILTGETFDGLTIEGTDAVDMIPVITIGATVPLTGPGAVNSGEAMRVALEIAADEINAAGGVVGMPIQLDIRDTAGIPELGAEAMDYFANQAGAVGVVGEYHSAVGLAMTEKAHEYHLPVIFADTWHDDITAVGYSEVFRIAPVSSEVYRAPADYVDELGFDNVVIMTDDSDFGQSQAATVESALTAKEISFQTFTAAEGETDFTSFISSIQDQDPAPQAVIVLLAQGDDAYIFEQQSAEAGLAPSADTVCIDTWRAHDSDAFWQNVPGGNYCVFKRIGLVQAHYNDRTVAFAAEYMSRTGKSFVESYAMEAYDSLIIMADAISRAGSTNPDAIIAALETTDLVGAQGRYYFPYGSGNPVPGGVPAYMWHQWPDPYILMLQYFEVGQTPDDAAVVYPEKYWTHGVYLIPYGGP